MDNYERLFRETRILKSESENFQKRFENMKETININLITSIEFFKKMDYKNAIDFITKAILETPENSNLWKQRGRIKEKAKLFEESIEDYKKSLFISGKDSYSTYNQIALNYMKLNVFDKALIAFDIAIEKKLELEKKGIDENLIPYEIDMFIMKVDFEKMYVNRANVKLSLKDYQGCSDDCNIAIKTNPEYSNSYFIAGLLFLNVEEKESAYKMLRIAENKGHSLALKAINHYF